MIGIEALPRMTQQVDALRKCIGLVSSGYLIRVQSMQSGFWYWKLVHPKNLNMMEVRWDAFGLTIRKNGSLVSMEPAPLACPDGCFSNEEF